MKLQLLTIERWKDDWCWDNSWSIAIGNIKIFDWCGCLLAIGKFDEIYQFDLLYLRSLMYKLFNWYDG